MRKVVLGRRLESPVIGFTNFARQECNSARLVLSSEHFELKSMSKTVTSTAQWSSNLLSQQYSTTRIRFDSKVPGLWVCTRPGMHGSHTSFLVYCSTIGISLEQPRLGMGCVSIVSSTLFSLGLIVISTSMPVQLCSYSLTSPHS